MEENTENKRRISEKKKRLNILDIISIVVIISLLALYAPRAISLYEERKEYLKEANKEKAVEYPLEVEISEEDTKFFVSFFSDYSIGITSGVDFTDDISQNEMIDFSRAILSEKYSSSGVISKMAMDNAIKKYFDVSDLNYTKLGYKSLSVYKEYEAKKLFNVTKLMQLEKDSNMYLVYADCVDKSNVQEGIYKKENIEDVYMFTFEKMEEESLNDNEVENKVRYILKKVEIERTNEEDVGVEK